MKNIILSVAAAVGLASAQSLTGVPECAKSCIVDYTVGNQIADCGQFDIACICSNEQFLDGIACCLEGACDEQGINDAISYARQICSTMDVEVPDEVVCKNPSGSTSGVSSTAAETETSSETSAAETSASETTDSSTETVASETTGSSTETADDSAVTETDAPDAAAPRTLISAGGVFGAVVALMFSL